MSKIAARIQIGWMTNWYKGSNPCEVMKKVEDDQDFECLLGMGEEYETTDGKNELLKLRSFLEKYYQGSLTVDDIKALDVHLSIGDIICHEIKIED